MNPLPKLLTRPLAISAAALFLFATYSSIRLAIANSLDASATPASIERAIHLDPTNPSYHIDLVRALLLGNPPPSLQTAASEIQQALALSPADSLLWINCAELAEQLHDFPRAETCLLRAVQLDRTFAPRWLLAEFYARRQDQLHFWPAMRAALATSYDDVTPLFETCWKLAANAKPPEDPALILPRALPDRPDVLAQYLAFLTSKSNPEPDPAIPAAVAARLVPNPDAGTAPALLGYCRRLLSRNQPAPALEIWNALAIRRLLPYAPLAPAHGQSLTDGDLASPALPDAAFNWTLTTSPGISADQESPSGLRLEFTGKQPEHIAILAQFLPLLPARSYQLAVRYQANAPALDTGLHLRLSPASAPKADLLQTAPPLSAADRTATGYTYRFQTPAAPDLILYHLALQYDRTLGTLRYEGIFHLQRIQLTLLTK